VYFQRLVQLYWKKGGKTGRGAVSKMGKEESNMLYFVTYTQTTFAKLVP